MRTLILLLVLSAAGVFIACGPTVHTASTTEAGSATYREPHRPQLHFTPEAQWMNDPNGMVFYDGEYHLFYQHYPDSTVWGPMHWGHAVSTDLVHWEHLPIALYPDSLGYIFSGSAVVDVNNTSGLGEGGRAPLVAIFTYHNAEREAAGHDDFQYQGIAYSNDRGRTWTKYTANPVVPNDTGNRDFRDPKVRWDDRSAQWVMTLAAQDHIAFYGSPNLIDWKHLSDFGKELGSHGGVWECPDLFPLEVASSDSAKWVLLVSINPGAPNGGSGTQYFIGEFDGKTFRPDPTFIGDVQDERGVWLDYGRDNYAGVTFSNIPEEDGRRLFLGWMSNWTYATVVPTQRWRSAMTVPRVLSLHRSPVGYRLYSQPVAELEAQRASAFTLSGGEDARSASLTEKFSVPARRRPDSTAAPFPKELELSYALQPGSTARFGVELSNAQGERYRIGYDAGTRQYFSDRSTAGVNDFSEAFGDTFGIAPRIVEEPLVTLHLILDRASAELFADGGATTVTELFFPSEDFDRVRLFAEGDGVRLLEGKGYTLESIWPTAR